MKTLSDVTTCKGKPVKNRLFRSATWERLAEADGRVTPRLEAVYAELVRGGIGGIIVSATCIDPLATRLPGQLGLWDTAQVPGHRRLTELGHAAGVLMLDQFAFAGAGGKRWSPADAGADVLRRLPERFAQAVALAREAGYDGAQIHAAHGYFLSQFLNPTANTRHDTYGGSPENRRRLLEDIYAAMRAEAGEDFLLAVKLDCRDLDGTPGVFEACLEAAKALDDAGIDLVEISGLGGNRGLADGPDQAESVFRREAASVAEAIGAAVMLVGANRSPATLTELVNNTRIAYFALSRPLLRQPDLPGRWLAGDPEPSQCVSCGNCYDDAGNRCAFVAATAGDS